MTTSTIPLQFQPFPNYTQLRSFLPTSLWHVLRVLSIAAALLIAYLLWSQPATGLPIFWGLAVPVLPLVFFVAPGIWRNICPLAASNQLPRLAGISRAVTNSTLSEGLAFPLGMLALFILVTARKLLFNTSGEATALLIVGAMLAALVGGLLFKGKSGWCSSICPLLPVQRLYGQTPFVKVANTHCQTCVGCAKNCYDFNPGTAYLADQYDAKRGYRSFRRFFAGVFPGFVLAFYLVPNPPAVTVGNMVLMMLLYMAISLALFHILDMLMQTMINVAPVVFAVAAINIYYWFSAPIFANTLVSFDLLAAPLLTDALAGFGWSMQEAFSWGLRALVLAVSLVWMWRSMASERLFLADWERQALTGLRKLTPVALEGLREFAGQLYPLRKKLAPASGAVTLTHPGLRASHPSRSATAPAGKAELHIDPDGQCTSLRKGQSLLEAIEGCDGKIKASCRMGVCGADPIAVTEGMEHLSPIGDDERATLQRLGCAGNTRMACSARMHGHGKVRVELEPHKAGQTQPTGVDDAPPVAADPDIRSVVIIGNGIAGITAAEHARRLHPTCEIHVLSREKHAPYNRMGIAHLINDRSGMQGLHLLPESWHRERRITSWLNTQVAEINVEARHVRLATNESIAFDRLILANGSSSWVPPIEGFGAPGSFVLREADEAMGLRDYVQRHGSRTAVVAGAGLLGLEAAHALQKLGLEVTVLSNTETILDRQLDAQSGQLLQTKLASQGIRILTRAEARTLGKDNRGHLGTVVLNDGSRLPADIFLACTGVKPNVELAKSCGIATGRGILVDKHMRTSLPDVYAAGDVAEHEGIAFGLWPVAVEQGEVAATNALGGHREYRGYVPATMLKVSGVDLLSVGNINAGPGETEIVDAQPECFQYRKLVLSSDRLVGAILFGYPEQASLIASLTKQGADLSSVSATLRRGDWGILAKLEMAAAA